MSIHLDDEGKPSATRAVVFIFVGLAALLMMADTFTAWSVTLEVWGLLKAVLIILVGAMATRSSVKHWSAGGTEE